MNLTQILLIDEQALCREGVKAVLASRPDLTIAAEARTGEEGLQAFRLIRPSLVVMDIQLPDCSGIDLIRQLLMLNPDARVLVCSNLTGRDHIYRALEAGASAYLAKTCHPAELHQAVDAARQGRRFVAPEIAGQLAPRHPQDRLTRREMDVLEQLVLGHGNREIGQRLGVSEKTVRVHMTSILSKLRAKDRTQAVLVALEQGTVDFLPTHRV